MSSDSLYSPFFITIAVPPATSTGSAARNPTAACRGLEPRSRAAAFHRREMASRVVRVAQVSRWPAPNRCVRSATSCFSASSRSRGSICRQFRWYSAKTSAAGIGRWGSRFHVMLRSPLKAAGAMDCGARTTMSKMYSFSERGSSRNAVQGGSFEARSVRGMPAAGSGRSQRASHEGR